MTGASPKAQAAMATVLDLFSKYGITTSGIGARKAIRASFSQEDLDTYTAAMTVLDGEGAIS